MAYDPNALVRISDDVIGRGSAYVYTTDDERATVIASGYFTAAATSGLSAGDTVSVVSGGTDSYELKITGVDTDGAATGDVIGSDLRSTMYIRLKLADGTIVDSAHPLPVVVIS